MSFNSFAYIIFLPLVVFFYFCLPSRWRSLMLLLVSCVFYLAFIPIYILILFLTITVDYWAGRLIEKAADHRAKKIYLIVSLVSTVAILFVFKYFNFFNVSLETLASFLHWNYSLKSLSLVLPIGLSFHTFQSLAYVIEVYRGKFPAEKNYLTYALYVMFFPQLVAGPIERPHNLLPQFYEKHDFRYDNLISGLRLILWGFFKKVVIADRLAIFVNQVYNNVYDYQGLPLLAATLFFAFQIYCDFSGYSDIARGSARLMGYRLMLNFRQPYFARNIAEFWQRWHISLSTWFKDYLYIPLGGNRVNKWRWYYNLFITFVISGLWHGANWTFLIWGGLHGFYMVLGKMIKVWRNKIWELFQTPFRAVLPKGSWKFLRPRRQFYSLCQIGLTFILVYVSWIFFRANAIKDAFYVLFNMFQDLKFNFGSLNVGWGFFDWLVALPALGILILVDLIEARDGVTNFLRKIPTPVRWAFYYTLIIMILFFGEFHGQQFIYFQF